MQSKVLGGVHRASSRYITPLYYTIITHISNPVHLGIVKKISAFFILLVMLSGIQFTSASLRSDQDVELTIYTYDSLLAFPGYDFIGNFSAYAGIPKDSIRLVSFSDASEIVTRASLEKDSPEADVLIGIDNVLVHKARNEEILTPYAPSTLSNIPQDLIDGLASDNLLTPYDYGVISLYYDKNKVTISENFTLTDLIEKDLANKLVLENPLLSSPGLGFLLWSIAEFGDGSAQWEEFWEVIRDEGRLVDSWGDAFNVFSAEESDRPIMVSYTSSPAFSACLYGDNSTAAALTLAENGKVRGWQQIEGIGLTKNAPNEEMAKKFIDWFIDLDVQENIYLNQWMYPAMEGINIPDCYSDSTYAPKEIMAYNDELPQNVVSENLDKWLDQWENLYLSTNNSAPFEYWFLGLAFVAMVVIKRRK